MNHGTVRKDGLVYYKYSNTKGSWVTAEKFQLKVEKKREYQRKCYWQYKMRNRIQRKMFEYDKEKGLYFCGVGSSGKEIWRDYNFVLRKKQKFKKYRSDYYKKLKSLPDCKLSVGDPHPEYSGIFVVYKKLNKPFFGTQEDLDEYRRKVREYGQSYRLKKKNALLNKA